ncbi:pyridoxal-phosphate dependent enzyme [Gordonia sp. Z-3]|jgi:cysteine synthase A|uniref:PLP-dependent cysteine synthase family protein n=1 Tax=unclassified Gordonia (in: high G+C Gram-positive bacteria) TaxID=2657482 RepID=UPI000C354085|nr:MULTISPECIES: pyridoxal-phosphate dependent enzyme [unclassified Gordonia (in: high G+C Gram-positive bacteria)]MAU81465.1 pyridoxal-5'-phosphate-dependent protein subunit beta [Gordonia sp. (in: high G+C Gram-positive bacteria)]MED5802143.1 pyridoxal-phosphate dependent enzyme [Gordonia sp. Z-3]
MSTDGLLTIGCSPLAHIATPVPRDHPGYYAKIEALAVGGLKARSAVSMVMGARSRGDLADGAAIVESTSGTLGIGLAYVAQRLGHPLTLVVDRELEPAMRNLLTALGTTLVVVDRPHPTGGWQQARLDIVHEIRNGPQKPYWPNQYDNPDNARGYLGLADEIMTDLGARGIERAEVLVCSVGTGGHSNGVGRRLREMWPHLRLIGVDAVGSTIFGQPGTARMMRGLGSSLHPGNVGYELFDEVHWVGPCEAVHACRALARDGFHTGGWSTGAVALVSGWAAARWPGTVVTIFPDGPERYLHNIFDDEWCNRRGLLGPPRRSPHEIDDCHDPTDCWTRCCSVRVPESAPAHGSASAPAGVTQPGKAAVT